MKRFLYTLVIALVPVLVAIVAVFLFVPLDKQFAYTFVKGDCSGHGKWIHDRLYLNEQPIDVAFIGSSVGWGLFDDRELTELLSNEAGKEVTVANLSYCRPGFNIQTLLIQELLNTKNPKHIIIELRDKPSMGGHPMFGYLASKQELFNPPTHFYQPFPSDVYHGLIVRWEQLRMGLYPEKQYRPDLNSFGYAPEENKLDSVNQKRIMAKRAAEDPHPEESLQQKIHFYIYWKNLEYIAKVCSEKNIELTFCYVNKLGRTSSIPRYKERLERIAPIWFPPDSIFQNPEHYWDPVHYNTGAVDEITPFLFQKLAQREY